MPLTGEAKRRFMRDYMREHRRNLRRNGDRLHAYASRLAALDLGDRSFGFRLHSTENRFVNCRVIQEG